MAKGEGGGRGLLRKCSGGVSHLQIRLIHPSPSKTDFTEARLLRLNRLLAALRHIPYGVPERADLPPRLISGAGPAVKSGIRRGIQKQRLPHLASSSDAVPGYE